MEKGHPQTAQFIKVYKGFLKYSSVSICPEKNEDRHHISCESKTQRVMNISLKNQSALHGSCYIMNIASLPGFKPCFTKQTANVSIKHYGKAMRKKVSGGPS